MIIIEKAKKTLCKGQRFKRFAICFGAIVVTVAGLGFRPYMRYREFHQFTWIVCILTGIDDVKAEAVYERRLKSGDIIGVKDLRETYPSDWSELNVAGEEYILNPVGTSPVVRLKHRLLDFPSGTEIPAEYAYIVRCLWFIDNAKRKGVREKVWKNGYDVTLETLEHYDYGVSHLYGDGEIATYTINPVGVPATARLIKPLPGFPAGTIIAPPDR